MDWSIAMSCISNFVCKCTGPYFLQSSHCIPMQTVLSKIGAMCVCVCECARAHQWNGATVGDMSPVALNRGSCVVDLAGVHAVWCRVHCEAEYAAVQLLHLLLLLVLLRVLACCVSGTGAAHFVRATAAASYVGIDGRRWAPHRLLQHKHTSKNTSWHVSWFLIVWVSFWILCWQSGAFDTFTLPSSLVLWCGLTLYNNILKLTYWQLHFANQNRIN